MFEPVITYLADYFSEIIAALGGAAIGITIAAFIGKKWISNKFDKNLAMYKSELDAKTEILKNNLSIFAHEQNVGISKIDAQRAEAIKGVYSAILRWDVVFNTIHWSKVYGDRTWQEQLEFYQQSSAKLDASLENIIYEMVNNALYVSSQTYDNIAKILKMLTIHTAKVRQIINDALKDHEIVDKEGHIMDELSKAKEIYDSKIDPVRGQLIKEFRFILRSR